MCTSTWPVRAEAEEKGAEEHALERMGAREPIGGMGGASGQDVKGSIDVVEHTQRGHKKGRALRGLFEQLVVSGGAGRDEDGACRQQDWRGWRHTDR